MVNWDKTVISARACCRDTPGFKRPIRINPRARRGAAARQPNVSAESDLHSKKAAGQDTDNRYRLILHGDALAQNGRIQIEPVLPEGPAHYRNVIVFAALITRPIAGYTKIRKEISGHIFAIHYFRLQAFSANVETGGRRSGDQGREDVIVISIVGVTLRRPIAVSARLTGIFLQEFHKPLWFPHRQQAQHQSVNQAENCGVGADPRASDSTATAVNPGVRRIMRSA